MITPVNFDKDSYNNFFMSDDDQNNSTSTFDLSDRDEASALKPAIIMYNKLNSLVTLVNAEFLDKLYDVDEEAVNKAKEFFNNSDDNRIL